MSSGSRVSLLLVFVLNAGPWQVASSAADGWGSLRGRIVFDGEAPAAQPLTVEKDPEICGKAGLVDESLLVHPQDHGLQHVAVWIDTRDPIPVHPDLAAVPDTPVVIDNQDCRFVPRMAILRTSQKLHLTNSDPIAHNAAVYVRRSDPFSEIIPQNQPLEKMFTRAETLPTRVDCSIHGWMKSFLIITEHPYAAITNASGEFELNNVPAGEWKIHFWHERSGNLRTLSQQGTAVPLNKGIWLNTVSDGETHDLGDLIAAPAQFEERK